MRSDVYFLPPRTSVTDSVGISTLPIFSCRPKAATRDSSDSLTLRSNPEYEWMMYHFIFGLRGASAVTAAPSPAGGASPPAPASFFSSSCMIKLNSVALSLVTEIAIQKTDALLNQVIDNKKINAKNKYRDHDHRGCGLHLFPRGRRHFAHFGAHVVVKRLRPFRPGFQPVSEVSGGCDRVCHLLRLHSHTALALSVVLPKILQGRRDSNPQVRFWRPAV